MAADRSIFTVSELNNAVARLLEQEFAWIWVEGEISNLATPASGHIYFTLKDASAQVRCAMFRNRNRGLGFKPENGTKVVVRCKVSLYAVRGDYQLIVDQMEQAGAGELQRKYEQLKQKLAAEGLFSEDRKQAIPEIPSCIGVITSRSGAAIRDVLSVIARRFPSVPVKLYPVPVQGEEAAPAICRALDLAQRHEACDVLLLVRGGGSLEDLWPFNEESVARAMFECSIPIVSGVGHEVDITIADFVADYRAATPTAAAEHVTPDQQAWMQTLDWYQSRLEQLIDARVQRLTEKLSWLRVRLSQQHPLRQLQRIRERVHEIEQRMQITTSYSIRSEADRLQHLHTRLLACTPVPAIRQHHSTVERLQQRMRFSLTTAIETRKARFNSLASTLNAISPLQTMSRGYSITSTLEGRTVTDSDSVMTNQRIRTRLHKGQLVSRIEKIITD